MALDRQTAKIVGAMYEDLSSLFPRSDRLAPAMIIATAIVRSGLEIARAIDAHSAAFGTALAESDEP